MKKLLITVLALTLAAVGYSQEYKVAKSSGRLEISEVNNVSIEGHNGNEIIFKARNQVKDNDPRAVGLRAMSNLGLEDNTGLGLSVVDKGDVIEVHQLKKTDGPNITIMVPKGVVVSYTHTSPFGEEIEFKNFAGEIKVSSVHTSVSLINTSGPMSVETVHGGIDASFATPLTAPVTLESMHGHVDVALPVATKATLLLGTEWGELLVDPSFKIEFERTGDLRKYSGQIKGTINGGGTQITLRAHHDNVYLRKK